MRKINLIAALLLGFVGFSHGQEQWNAARIQHEINKLPVKGTVLYIAAHPDDENTRLITWLANEKKFRTAYLSLTRGDGGQNLIGNELGVKLGIIRTHELMAARRLDGGEQFFTRAFDFGYSKSPEETFTKWNKDSILSDMVFVIRKIQPDVIITRFPTGGYPTHGHHTASAILASEAFEAAADPQRFPEQFSYGVKPWKVKALFWNASTWWNKNLPEIAAQNDSFFSVDVGGFNPLLGASYTEIAGRSRSMHKSQGFGSAQTAGQEWEYLKLIQSHTELNQKYPFAFISETIEKEGFKNLFNKISYTTDNNHFNEYMTNIVNMYKWFDSNDSTPLLQHRKEQIKEIVRQSLGLKMELNAELLKYGQGSTLPVEFSILTRLGEGVKLQSIVPEEGVQSVDDLANKPISTETGISIKLPFKITLSDEFYTELPWLSNGLSGSMFANSWRDGGIYPGIDRSVRIDVAVIVNETVFHYSVPLAFKSIDPVKGERNFPVIIQPRLEAKLESDNLLFINKQEEQLSLSIISHAPYKGRVYTHFSGHFSSSKGPRGGFDFQSDTSYQLNLSVSLLTPNGQGIMEFRAEGTELRKVNIIEYDHIGIIQHCEVPKLNLNALEIKSSTRKIAYLQGAGDDVADYLRITGFDVTDIRQDDLIPEVLSKYNVIILGIRAYNTLNITDEQQKNLMDYAQNGGHVIVQYLTTRGLKRKNFGPYPLEITHDRVTQEDAAMNFISDSEPLLIGPNKITETDFSNWVQERGLYFAGSWDEHYRPVFRCHDTGEPDLEGALLVADYGKGSFIYTGISFFRQLPAGVPGAYRLLGNLIEYQNPG
ncbi:MAG: PIG-L family deacetylase [Bacteroidetes bacterium]|nr:PIG-L family deacetylase [Bacteroidota bacterium]